MRRHLCTLLLLLVPTSGCATCREILWDAIFSDDDEPDVHIDDEVFERKGIDRDSPQGRRLQQEVSYQDRYLDRLPR